MFQVVRSSLFEISHDDTPGEGDQVDDHMVSHQKQELPRSAPPRRNLRREKSAPFGLSPFLERKKDFSTNKFSCGQELELLEISHDDTPGEEDQVDDHDHGESHQKQ
ncbi:hypothetical protein MMC07_006950 [Pseudocyphellaria aurata]|nr:hypothetical protein [Pseudocyphellaria aurata]